MAKEEPKSLPEVLGELKDLTAAYGRQEVLDPLGSLGRFLRNGIPGAILLAIGSCLLGLAGLRALQTETGDVLDGTLSFVPYLIVIVVLALIAVLAITRVGAGERAAKKRREAGG